MEMNLPYIEKSNFHLHLTGALSPQEISYVAKDLQVEGQEYLELEKKVDFDQPEIWVASKALTSTPEGLDRYMHQAVHNEFQDRVGYLELTINPYGMVRRGFKPEAIGSCLNSFLQHEKTAHPNNPNLFIKFGVNRKDGPTSIRDVLAVYSATPPEIRWGIDLNGDERQYPTEYFINGFREMARMGISTVIHAGEFPDMVNSLSLALDAEPTRIAHAISAGNSRSLIERIANQGVVIESSPLSNIKRGAVENLSEHPIRKFLDNYIKVVMGTDDPGFFNNTMSDELASLRQVGLTDTEILELNEKMNNLRINEH